MALAERRAEVTWEGDLIKGQGRFKVGSGALPESTVTWASRTERSDGKTSPEELLAAANASCFSMALSHALATGGNTPTRLDVKATCTFDRVDGKPTVVSMDLDVTGLVPGIDEEAFKAAAEEASRDCPISRAIKQAVKIRLTTRLAKG